jgi:hypothetical protein
MHFDQIAIRQPVFGGHKKNNTNSLFSFPNFFLLKIIKFCFIQKIVKTSIVKFYLPILDNFG